MLAPAAGLEQAYTILVDLVGERLRERSSAEQRDVGRHGSAPEQDDSCPIRAPEQLCLLPLLPARRRRIMTDASAAAKRAWWSGSVSHSTGRWSGILRGCGSPAVRLEAVPAKPSSLRSQTGSRVLALVGGIELDEADVQLGVWQPGKEFVKRVRLVPLGPEDPVRLVVELDRLQQPRSLVCRSATRLASTA